MFYHSVYNELMNMIEKFTKPTKKIMSILFWINGIFGKFLLQKYPIVLVLLVVHLVKVGVKGKVKEGFKILEGNYF